MKKFLKIVFIALACCLTSASVLTLAACKCNHEYVDGKCIKCGEWVITEGVEYALTDDGNSYGVVGFSSKAAAEVYILPEYNSKPVTTIFREAFVNSNIVSVNIPDSVTTIEGLAFAGCGRLVKVNIPDTITSIGNDVFAGCSSLTSITIPDSVTSIGGSAFSGCEKLMQRENDIYYVDGWAVGFDGWGDDASIKDGTRGIAAGVFSGRRRLTSITIPDSVTSIGTMAFYECSGLTSVTIGNGVTSIGDHAFLDCSSLTSITIPDSVMSIGVQAFAECSSLTSITIPDRVTSIEWGAFKFCSSLEEVNYTGTEEQWNKIDISYDNDYLKNAKRNYIK